MPQSMRMGRQDQDPEKVLSAQIFFNHNIYTDLHAWTAKDTFNGYESNLLRAVKAVHVCQQITASIATCPLAA